MDNNYLIICHRLWHCPNVGYDPNIDEPLKEVTPVDLEITVSKLLAMTNLWSAASSYIHHIASFWSTPDSSF